MNEEKVDRIWKVYILGNYSPMYFENVIIDTGGFLTCTGRVDEEGNRIEDDVKGNLIIRDWLMYHEVALRK